MPHDTAACAHFEANPSPPPDMGDACASGQLNRRIFELAAFCSKVGCVAPLSAALYGLVKMTAIVAKLQAAPDPFDPENLRLDQSFVETSWCQKIADDSASAQTK